MPKPLLYRPPPRWHVWAALGGAALIHTIAVVAAMRHEAPAVDLRNIPDAVAIGLDQQEQPPEPTPPPEQPKAPPPHPPREEREAPPPPPPQTVEPEFKEEQPSPPPKNKPAAKVAPLAKPAAAMMGASGAKANAIFGPKPGYPYEARAKRLTGSGVCVVTVDPATGNVTNAEMVQ